MAHVQAILICERTLEEKDGVISVMRLVDAVINRSGAWPFMYPLTALVIFRTEKTDEVTSIKLDIQSPSGRVINGGTFTNTGRGQNVVFNLQVTFIEAGQHWFNVYLGKDLANRAPLTVISPHPAGSGLGISELVKGEIITP